MLGVLAVATSFGLLAMMVLAYCRTRMFSLALLIGAIPLSTLLTLLAERLVLDRLAEGVWLAPEWLTIGEVAFLMSLARDIGFLGLAYWLVRDVRASRSAPAR
jgi:hypothetical protein